MMTIITTIRDPDDIIPFLRNGIPRHQGVSDYFTCQGGELLQGDLLAIAKRALQENEPLELLKKLAEYLSEHQIQDAVENPKGAKQILEEAKFYFNQVEKRELPPTIASRLETVLHAVDAIIDTLINAFALSDVFKHPENEMEASFRFQKMMLLATFVPAITAVLTPLIGLSVSSALITLGVLALLIGLTISYSKYLRPLPRQLPHAENWSDKAHAGHFNESLERKLYSERLVEALQKGSPLLVGEPGVGKTKLLEGFAFSVEHGDYPGLKGKKIFYFNTPELLKGGNPYKILTEISQELGRHRGDAILIFNQVEEYAEALRSFLNGSHFPYAIGVASRSIPLSPFQEIRIGSADFEETLPLLKRLQLRCAPDIVVERKVFREIYEKTGSNQPGAALNGLRSALERMRESAAAETLRLAEAQKERLLADHQTSEKEFEQLEGELDRIKQQLQKEAEEMREAANLKSSYRTVKEGAYRAGAKTALLAHHYFLPEWERRMLLNRFAALKNFSPS